MSSDRPPLPEGSGDWFARQTTRSLRRTRELVNQLALGPRQRALLLAAIGSLDEKLARSPEAGHSFLPFIHLPQLVAMAVSGTEDESVPVSVAATLIFVGFDIIDDEA